MKTKWTDNEAMIALLIPFMWMDVGIGFNAIDDKYLRVPVDQLDSFLSTVATEARTAPDLVWDFRSKIMIAAWDTWYSDTPFGQFMICKSGGDYQIHFMGLNNINFQILDTRATLPEAKRLAQDHYNELVKSIFEVTE